MLVFPHRSQSLANLFTLHPPFVIDELTPLFPFLPKYSKDSTKPTCFLESIDVTLVWKSEDPTANAQKKRKKGKQSNQSAGTQVSGVPLSQVATQSVRSAEGTHGSCRTRKKSHLTFVVNRRRSTENNSTIPSVFTASTHSGATVGRSGQCSRSVHDSRPCDVSLRVLSRTRSHTRSLTEYYPSNPSCQYVSLDLQAKTDPGEYPQLVYTLLLYREADRDLFIRSPVSMSFPPLLSQHLQTDVPGIDSIAESCRKMFEQTKNRAFKRQGGSIYTVSSHSSATSYPLRCLLLTRYAPPVDDVSQSFKAGYDTTRRFGQA